MDRIVLCFVFLGLTLDLFFISRVTVLGNIIEAKDYIPIMNFFVGIFAFFMGVYYFFGRIAHENSVAASQRRRARWTLIFEALQELDANMLKIMWVCPTEVELNNLRQEINLRYAILQQYIEHTDEKKELDKSAFLTFIGLFRMYFNADIMESQYTAYQTLDFGSLKTEYQLQSKKAKGICLMEMEQ